MPPFSPDYSGLESTLRVKLTRMKPQTASIVRHLTNSSFDKPSLSGFLLELAPSLVTVPLMNSRVRKQREANGVARNQAAYASIANAERIRALDQV